MVLIDREGVTVFGHFWDKLFHLNSDALTALPKRLDGDIRRSDTIWGGTTSSDKQVSDRTGNTTGSSSVLEVCLYSHGGQRAACVRQRR